jgi:hypothetical protein
MAQDYGSRRLSPIWWRGRARNVQAWMKMTPDERRAKPPWLTGCAVRSNCWDDDIAPRRVWGSAMAPLGATSVPLPPVFVLVGVSFPSAIIRRVWPVVVNAAERNVRRLLSHVGEKVFETVKPSIANLDAASTVVFVALCVRVVATGEHLHP